MPQDKYLAVWVSHSSISDFLECPRAYFLKNVYKNPKTGHKMTLMSPALALGQIVHEVLESLSVLPTEVRLKENLLARYEKQWQKVSGEKGGFMEPAEEERYFERGKEMLQRVVRHPGPIARLAVKIKEDLPWFWLSQEDNIILCGKIDWLEYLKEEDGVHIIDFKTSRNEEGADSLQLPIYQLVASYTQSRKVLRSSYWYLNLNDELTEKKLPELEKSREKILKIAREIKLAKALKKFSCKEQTGCRKCRQYERVLNNEAKFVGVDNIRRDVYILAAQEYSKDKDDSVIL